MTESRLDPSDAQISRHAMGQLAEQASIMRQCLIEQAFIGSQLDALLITWWEVTLKNAFSPNLGEMMKGIGELLNHEEDDE